MLIIDALNAQNISTTEVKVVEGFKPSIPTASRLNENAVFSDTIQKDRTQVYHLLDKDLRFNYKMNPLKPAIVKPDKISILKNTRLTFLTGYKIRSALSQLNLNQYVYCIMLLRVYLNQYFYCILH